MTCPKGSTPHPYYVTGSRQTARQGRFCWLCPEPIQSGDATRQCRCGNGPDTWHIAHEACAVSHPLNIANEAAEATDTGRCEDCGSADVIEESRNGQNIVFCEVHLAATYIGTPWEGEYGAQHPEAMAQARAEMVVADSG